MRDLAFTVNSSPGAGLRFAPSVTVKDAAAALAQAGELERRGMRQIRIRDMETGEIFDERGLRQHLLRLRQAAQNEETE